MQEFSPDLIVGTSYYICTSMLSAKLRIPHVTIAPSKCQHCCCMHHSSAPSQMQTYPTDIV